jgi:hypothetical protein
LVTPRGQSKIITAKGEGLLNQLLERLETPPTAIARLTNEEQEQLLALVKKAWGDAD